MDSTLRAFKIDRTGRLLRSNSRFFFCFRVSIRVRLLRKSAAMKKASNHASSTEGHPTKGAEIFIGGLPSTVTEEIIDELFSPFGKILERRMMKDKSGKPKGFCFVRYASKEAALRAQKEKDKTEVHGKTIGVAFSQDQDTLFFGNLRKDWSLKDFEKLIHQKFQDVISIDLPTSSNAEDSSGGKKILNRGFAFIQFSTHAAAARAHRMGTKPDFLLDDKWHPSVDWAEKEPEIDAEELAKIKVAFVGNLPKDADEEYLMKLFDPVGKVERVALSRKGQSPVGFVHFANRSDLDNAIKEMDGKTVYGPHKGPSFKIQVAVAKPGGKDRKRLRDEHKIKLHDPNQLTTSNRHNQDPSDCKSKAPRLSEAEPVSASDPYEEAVLSLPATVKERLLRVLRLGIATRYDVDIHCVTSIKRLPESAAIAILDQFLISGAHQHDKQAYLASLVSKAYFSQNQIDRFADEMKYISQQTSEYKLKEEEPLSLYGRSYPSWTDHSVAKSEESEFLGRGHLRPGPIDHSAANIAKSELLLAHNRLARQPNDQSIARSIETELLNAHGQFHPPPTDQSSIRYTLSPPLSQHASLYDDPGVFGRPKGNVSSYSSVRTSMQHESSVIPNVLPYGSNIRSNMPHRSSNERPLQRPQMRFDPFTGEPYKFDPFTGEPIQPEPTPREQESQNFYL